MAENNNNTNAQPRASNTPSSLQGIKRELIVTGDLSGQAFGFATRIARIDTLITSVSMRAGQYDEIRRARKTMEDAFDLLDRAIKTVTGGLNKPTGNSRKQPAGKRGDNKRPPNNVSASPSSINAGNQSAGVASVPNTHIAGVAESESQGSDVKAPKKSNRKNPTAGAAESPELTVVGSVETPEHVEVKAAANA